MTRPFEPMLASPADLDALKFPLWASPKLDGIRAVVRDGVVLSRKLIRIPHLQVQKMFSQFEHLDGELIVGSPTAPDAMQASMAVTRKSDAPLNVSFFAFDHIEHPADAFADRLKRVQTIVSETGDTWPGLTMVTHTLVRDLGELLAFESKMLEFGYEGIMLRDPAGRYKFGRSTAREGLLLKVKRFEDAEAKIIGCVAEMENTNAAQTSNVGRTKRSTATDGLVPKNILGAFVVRGINGRFKDVEFSVGGFTAAQKAEFWRLRDNLAGKIIKYKFFGHGAKDAPRHPGFLGFRDPIDL